MLLWDNARMDAALVDLLDTVARHHDVNTMTTKAMPLVVNYLGAENGSLMLLRGEQVIHKVLATKETFTEVTDHKTRAVISGGLAGWAMHHKQGGLASDTALDNRWISMGDTTIRSAMVVPMISRGAVIGLLSLHHGQAGALRERHLACAADLAQLLAPVFDTAMLIESSLAAIAQACQCAGQPSAVLDWHGKVIMLNAAMEALDIIWNPGDFSQSLLPRELAVDTVGQCNWAGARKMKTMPYEAQTIPFPGIGVWMQLVRS